MKNQILLSILFLLSFGLSVQGQTKVIQDKQGNYTAVVKSGRDGNAKAKETGKFFIAKDGTRYPVMESAKGKLFYTRVSKKSNQPYNVYITSK